MSNQNDIRNLTGIQDKNITFDDQATEFKQIKGKRSLMIQATLTYIPEACKHCGTINEDYSIIKNGTQTSTIKWPMNPFQPTYIKLRKQRFLCRSCSSSFVAETPLVKANCFIANPVKAGVAIEATRASSIEDIASRMHISWHTASLAIAKAAKEADPFKVDLPPHLSFDEFKYKKSKLAFDYINAETGRILGILRGTTKRVIRDHFISRYSLKERRQVETITVDMNSGYIAIIHELFPNAKVLIDRFHLVQLISRAFNKTRVQYMNQLNSTSPDQKKYRRLKYYWRLFLKKATDLNYTVYKDYHLFGRRTQSGILEEMLGYDDSLRRHYEVFQAILKAFDDNDMTQLKSILEADHDGLSRYLKTAIKTLTKHLDYIQNTFKYPYSNGRIEGNHNKIKLINRIAYGHRNMTNLTNRIILHFNLRSEEKAEAFQAN